MNIDFKTAAKAVGGFTDSDATFTSVFTDSRHPVDGGLFIAIKGSSFDGHNFVNKMGENVAGVMVRNDFKTNLPAIYVEDTIEAMLRLSAFYRSQFDIPIVGLTGSVGKTTTKDMIYCVLSEKFNALKTLGNLNNNIGMPQTLFRLNNETQAAVIEMGMNHKGEISELSKALRPTIGVITSVGTAHIENLGSRENILKAKLEILDGMEKGSTLILNGDNDMLRNVYYNDYNIIRTGITDVNADVTAYDIVSDECGVSFTIQAFDESADAKLCVPGHHNIYNALSAVAVGHSLGISLDEAVRGLAKYNPEGLRQNIVREDGITKIIDCYNSNPESAKAALDVLADMPGRKIAVLGDMLELGTFSKMSHAEVGYHAAARQIDILYTYGEEALHIANAANLSGITDVRSFTECRNLANSIKNELNEGDNILFKASRAMNLENVIELVFGKV